MHRRFTEHFIYLVEKRKNERVNQLEEWFVIFIDEKYNKKTGDYNSLKTLSLQ
jgi:hypothetical protein